MNQKPCILVSACLLGHPVRYDGQHKYCATLEELKNEFDLISVCPEVGAGLSTPRPAVNLYLENNKILAKGADEPELNVTAPLNNWISEYIKTLKAHGAILKSKSPSCGFKTTPVYTNDGHYFSNGLFANALDQSFLPIIDELQIQNKDSKSKFLSQVWSQFHAR
ncbi:MAG: DUF523 domain-containing protein [Bdellovibrionales bacterium]|nr:DUF523 domain-containing protein [Bdellovibrionales bacterium]